MNQSRLLIIDDEEDMRALVHMYLKSSGFEVYQAANGEEALEIPVCHVHRSNCCRCHDASSGWLHALSEHTPVL